MSAARTEVRLIQSDDVAGIIAPPPLIHWAALIIGVFAHLAHRSRTRR